MYRLTGIVKTAYGFLLKPTNSAVEIFRIYLELKYFRFRLVCARLKGLAELFSERVEAHWIIIRVSAIWLIWYFYLRPRSASAPASILTRHCYTAVQWAYRFLAVFDYYLILWSYSFVSLLITKFHFRMFTAVWYRFENVILSTLVYHM